MAKKEPGIIYDSYVLDVYGPANDPGQKVMEPYERARKRMLKKIAIAVQQVLKEEGCRKLEVRVT